MENNNKNTTSSISWFKVIGFSMITIGVGKIFQTFAINLKGMQVLTKFR